MTDELTGYDQWRLRSAEEQDELDRAWARRGRRERDPDRDRDAQRDRDEQWRRDQDACEAEERDA